MIGIIKILAIVYLTLSVIYFMVTGKQNLIYGVKYSTTIWAKIYSAFWMKDCVKVGKRVVSIYKAYRQIKKLNKK